MGETNGPLPLGFVAGVGGFAAGVTPATPPERLPPAGRVGAALALGAGSVGSDWGLAAGSTDATGSTTFCLAGGDGVGMGVAAAGRAVGGAYQRTVDPLVNAASAIPQVRIQLEQRFGASFPDRPKGR